MAGPMKLLTRPVPRGATWTARSAGPGPARCGGRWPRRARGGRRGRGRSRRACRCGRRSGGGRRACSSGRPEGGGVSSQMPCAAQPSSRGLRAMRRRKKVQRRPARSKAGPGARRRPRCSPAARRGCRPPAARSRPPPLPSFPLFPGSQASEADLPSLVEARAAVADQEAGVLAPVGAKLIQADELSRRAVGEAGCASKRGEVVTG